MIQLILYSNILKSLAEYDEKSSAKKSERESSLQFWFFVVLKAVFGKAFRFIRGFPSKKSIREAPGVFAIFFNRHLKSI